MTEELTNVLETKIQELKKMGASNEQADGHYNNIINVANNDGLKYLDWRRWFKDYDLSKPLAVVHFTKFRY